MDRESIDGDKYRWCEMNLLGRTLPPLQRTPFEVVGTFVKTVYMLI